jgi:hypothetical protein
LRDVNEPTLNALRQQLIKEVSEVARALYWVDGIIRLKDQTTSLQEKKRRAAMTLPIISSDERLNESRGIKGCIFGRSFALKILPHNLWFVWLYQASPLTLTLSPRVSGGEGILAYLLIKNDQKSTAFFIKFYQTAQRYPLSPFF